MAKLNRITRYQFLELLLRLAVTKYYESHAEIELLVAIGKPTISKNNISLDRFFKEFLSFNKLSDRFDQPFRHKWCYNLGVSNVLYTYVEEL